MSRKKTTVKAIHADSLVVNWTCPDCGHLQSDTVTSISHKEMGVFCNPDYYTNETCDNCGRPVSICIADE